MGVRVWLPGSWVPLLLLRGALHHHQGMWARLRLSSKGVQAAAAAAGQARQAAICTHTPSHSSYTQALACSLRQPLLHQEPQQQTQQQHKGRPQQQPCKAGQALPQHKGCCPTWWMYCSM